MAGVEFVMMSSEGLFLMSNLCAEQVWVDARAGQCLEAGRAEPPAALSDVVATEEGGAPKDRGPLSIRRHHNDFSLPLVTD